MPSVRMRRSTRVFGARVLRSGRRLWTEPHEVTKTLRTENHWTKLLEDSDLVCNGARQEDEIIASDDINMEERATGCDMEVENVDTMYGIVYRRKRKRVESGRIFPAEDKRFGKKYFRKNVRVASSFETRRGVSGPVSRFCELAVVSNGLSCECGYWITWFLTTVLSYMTRIRIGVRRLSKFLLSEPISDSYSSYGVLFLEDSATVGSPVICIISGSKSSIPLFSMNFFAFPSFFVYMQTYMYLILPRSAILLVAHSFNIYEKDKKDRDLAEHSFGVYEKDENSDSADYAEEQHLFPIPSHTKYHNFITVESQFPSGRKDFPHSPTSPVTKSPLRTSQSRSSRHIRKRRSSVRRKRGRAPSGFRTQKASGTLAADFLRIRQETVHLSSATKNIKDLKCASAHDTFATGCSVNLLITEPDKCYREEGATVSLESSASKQCFLSVTKDGIKKYSLAPEKVMRPCWTNRFSRATIWAIDGGVKLEFFHKHDWLIFKELYKECYNRNMLLPAASVIPVPGVQEVPGHDSMNYKAYARPDSYISVKDDELTRALVKKSAIYDMDSDDEAWLKKLNDEVCGGAEVSECVSPESFELVVDALEKSFHCNPGEIFDEQGGFDFCLHLERREVVEAIHSYWVRKRKQKRAALVRIFQLYQPRRIQVIPKSILRKKRSFKRPASQVGRAKQRPLLQAIEAKQDALEQQKNAQKLQEAKASVGRFEGLAILKRQRAQILMANADLYTYKAIMALRIAQMAEARKDV